MKVNRFGLTPQQENFANLLADGTRTQADAYRQAYPASLKWKQKVVHEKASVLAAHEKVGARVAALREAAADRVILKTADILEETRRIALSNAAGIIGMKDGKPYVLMPNELDAATVAAVKSFKIDDLGRIEYQFWDKNASLERAARILGLYKKDNEQKVDRLAALLGALPGNVVTPSASAAEPDGPEVFGVADEP